MNTKLFMLVMTLAIILPCGLLLSACGGKKNPPEVKETSISVYIDGVEVNGQNNTIDITYGDYTDVDELISNTVSVVVNYNDNTTGNLSYGSSGFTIAGLPQTLNANEQGYNLTLSYKNFTKDLNLIVHKANFDFSNVGWSYDGSYPFTYDGDEKTIELINIPNGVEVNYQGNIETNAGTYTAIATVEYDEINYNIINDENLVLTQQWTINKAQIDMWSVIWNYSATQPFTYDGEEKTIELINIPNEVEVNYEDNKATNAGTYNASATLDYDTINYELININFTDSMSWTINKQQVIKPKITSSRLFYNGQEQSGVDYRLEDEGILFTVNGDTVATNAGQYSVTFALINVTNFEWNDGTTNNVVLDWEIEQVPLYANDASWNYNIYEPFIYDGQEKSVAITNLPAGLTIKNYTGTISATDAGTYTAGVVFEYDDINYYLSGAPQSLEWKIEKAVNTLSGTLVMDGITYGEVLGDPSGVSALFGEITYKYYNNQYEEISKPTNVGTYYVKAFSLGNNNWISNETDYKQFYITKCYLESPELVQSNFIYTGDTFTPEFVEAINAELIEMSGDLSASEIGKYSITFALIDKANYGWADAYGTAQEADNIVLEWSIINSPLTMTLNDNVLTASEFEALTQFNIGDNWYVTVSEGYNYSLNYEYMNANNVKVWSGATDEGSNSNLDVTINPSNFTYIIKITQNAQIVYTKTITVNHNVFENVMVGDTEMTFEEFIANPQVEYGKNLKINLKSQYTSIFTFSQNDFVVTENATITVTYQILDTRVYETIEVVCLIEPIESVTVGTQTLSYEEFIANPVVKYGDALSINLKAGYDEFFTNQYYPYVVKEDVQIVIYMPNGEIFDTINVECNFELLVDIDIDGESFTFEQLMQMNTIHLGSTLNFTVNEEFADLIQITINKNGQDIVLTGQQTFTFNDMNSLNLNIREVQTQSYVNSIYFNVILFDSIQINDNVINLTNSTYVEYSRDRDETNFTIIISEDVLSKYELFYQTDTSITNVQITQSTLQISLDEIKEYLYIYAVVNDESTKDSIQVLTIHITDFCPVEMVSAEIYQQGYVDYPQYSIYEHKIDISSYGAIFSLNIQFKDNYLDCTYKIFDEEGNEIQDFTTIQNNVYTVKVYLSGSEIYSFLLNVKYRFDNLIDGIQYIGEESVASLVTNSNLLIAPILEDTEYFTNQIITYNGSSEVTLVEGQQTIKVTYTFTANQKTFNYSFDLIVEYVLDEQLPTQYVNNIQINYQNKWGNSSQVYFDNNLQFSDYEYTMSDIAFVEEKDIIIDTIYTVISKEIKFSANKTFCWLEYVLSIDGQNKTFRAYIKTNGTVSNNINAEIIFSDAKTKLNITDLIVNNSYTIQKVNVYGDLDINTEDANARVKYYFNGEEIQENNFQLNSVGTYAITIISSDNTTTRTINIIVEGYENLMFEVFYDDTRLYLEYSNDGPIGNMKMQYDPLVGPYFIGYFGYVDLSGLTQVSISGSSAYEGMLYYSDKETPITNLDNLVLDLLIDTDGSLTKIVGAEYVLVYANIDNAYYAIYFVFEDRPPYPMTFNFDINKDGVIDDNDTQISIKVDLNEIGTGIVDLGDFIVGEAGPSIELTREELGMTEIDTSAEVVINWLSTFDDYSYQYFTEVPEGGNVPSLIGPSQNNLTSTLTLNFVDDGSGRYVATIYVCSEGATLETLMELVVPVTFILVD